MLTEWWRDVILILLLIFDAAVGIVVPLEFALSELRRNATQKVTSSVEFPSPSLERPRLHWPLVALASMAFITGAVYFLVPLISYQDGPSSDTRPNTETPSPPPPQYLDNINVLVDAKNGRPLRLTAKASVTTNGLRIFVDYVDVFFATPPTTVFIKEMSSVVKGQDVGVLLINAAHVEGNANTLWWGDPKADHPVPGFQSSEIPPHVIIRARVRILDQGGKEQHYYFEFARIPGNEPFFIIPRPTYNWISTWESGAK